MSKNLVIVESPAKAKTIEKYLGPDFTVLASYGHIRDLISKEGAVEPNNNFFMHYAPIDRNTKHFSAIKKALKDADNLYLATDPDREGEAISWHLLEMILEDKKLKDIPHSRVVFHEITKKAVNDAIASPRSLAMDLVNAQQARRALDYLVGFNLSPLLWRKIKPGLSAGRVQSPALRLIVEREEEIEKFVTQEYWSHHGDFAIKNQKFTAKLQQYDGNKIEQFSFTNEKEAMAVRDAVLAAANGEVTVTKVEKKQRKRNPAAPFTTSTLQQEAARKLGFTSQRTMRIAQQLYEGVETNEGTVGLISYMRTDAVTLSKEALSEIRKVIAERYGKDNVPEVSRTYKTKSKNAQEAHEAIRPTSAFRTPDSITSYLTSEQSKLYDLIWKRTIACQMIHATMNTVSNTLSAGNHAFRATGSTIANPGFMSVYLEGKDDIKGDDDSDEEKILPEMTEGQLIPLADVAANQHFTDPPPRFSEASLVKTLEEYGIGRPSTYASIISTLQYREYVEMDGRRFIPTDTGRIVSRFLSGHFTQYVDYEFTATLEDDLDAVSRGELDWIEVLQKFWQPFHVQCEDKMESVTREEVQMVRELGIDPRTEKPVYARMARYGAVVQLGHRDDDEKPKFSSLRKHQRIESITLEEALELFNLPRDLGETEEGDTISTNFGRFGPYVRYGSKFVSIKEDDPYTITRDRALEVIAEHKAKEAAKLIRDFGDEIKILNGRWGPYVTNGEKNARVPKDIEAAELTHAECIEMLEKAPAKPTRGKKKATISTKKAAAKKAPAKKATAKKATTKKAATAKKTAAKKPSAKKTSE
jgi:DNA topoisomerase-1